MTILIVANKIPYAGFVFAFIVYYLNGLINYFAAEWFFGCCFSFCGSTAHTHPRMPSNRGSVRRYAYVVCAWACVPCLSSTSSSSFAYSISAWLACLSVLFTCIRNALDYEYACNWFAFIRSTGHRYCSAQRIKILSISKSPLPLLPFFHELFMPFSRKTNKF